MDFDFLWGEKVELQIPIAGADFDLVSPVRPFKILIIEMKSRKPNPCPRAPSHNATLYRGQVAKRDLADPLGILGKQWPRWKGALLLPLQATGGKCDALFRTCLIQTGAKLTSHLKLVPFLHHLTVT